MNWLDVIIALVLVISLIGAFRNGLSREFVRLVALAVGVVGGMWWYKPLSIHFEPHIASRELAEFAAFMAFLIASLVAGSFVGWFLAKLLGWTGLRWFDRLLGAAFGAVRGLLVCAALVLAVIAFSPVTGSDKAVASSRLAPWVLYGAKTAVDVAPDDLRTDFSQGFQRVRMAWIEGVPDSASQVAKRRAGQTPSRP